MYRSKKKPCHVLGRVHYALRRVQRLWMDEWMGIHIGIVRPMPGLDADCYGDKGCHFVGSGRGNYGKFEVG